jgi:tRNA (guanine37-N1)-methyltransferase
VRIDIVTLFPAMLEAPLTQSILGRARARGLVDVRVHDLREHATGRHRVTDEPPFGGGGGMVLKPEPIAAAVDALRADGAEARVILLGPAGRRFSQDVARELARRPRLILLCGRYEGVDERVAPFVDEELSIGDYVISGGELAALVVLDAVVRLIPGVLGNETSPVDDSFATGLLEGPQYTRPAEFRGVRVPDVLVSGAHASVTRWRREQALATTLARRPDLLDAAPLDAADRAFLGTLGWKRRDG